MYLALGDSICTWKRDGEHWGRALLAIERRARVGFCVLALGTSSRPQTAQPGGHEESRFGYVIVGSRIFDPTVRPAPQNAQVDGKDVGREDRRRTRGGAGQRAGRPYQ